MVDQYRQIEFERTKIALKSEREIIHQIPGVLGSGITHSDITGIGKGFHPIFYLQFEDPYIIDQLPGEINGMPVAYQVTGEINALGVMASSVPCPSSCTSNCGFTYRYRPLQGGASTGNPIMLTLGYCDAGTIGGFPIVVDPTADDFGQYVILSNNHVLAHDTPGEKLAQVGQIIIQPGTIDGGDTVNDIVSSLKKWIPVVGTGIGTNTLDCARTTKINPGISINQTNLCNYRINYAIPPVIGMNIVKAGRTTSCTNGTIVALDATIYVNYGVGGVSAIAEFTGQFQTTSGFVAGGDSGSVVVTNDSNTNAVGLAFSASGDGTTFCNVISDVESALGVSFGTAPVTPTPTPVVYTPTPSPSPTIPIPTWTPSPTISPSPSPSPTPTETPSPTPSPSPSPTPPIVKALGFSDVATMVVAGLAVGWIYEHTVIRK